MQRFYNLPEELRLLPQWVCWCGDKVPKNAKTGGNAQSSNPSTWSTFDEAIRACELYGFDGIGFMFKENGGYFGVDLDHCQENKAFCDEFIDTLQSYNEYSRSGTGLHIICKGVLPDGSRRKGGVEMYSEGRYFICTGNIYNARYKAIIDCTESIKPLHKKYLNNAPKSLEACTFAPVNMDDEKLLQQASSSKNGLLFDMLYSGNYENLYHSHSEADMALCCILAFWTGCNANSMDRLFRSSGLMRPKWDERHGALSYGAITIKKAIDGCRDVYNPMK